MSTSPPPQTDKDAYTIGGEEFAVELQKLKTLLSIDVTNLEKSLESLGAPYTPGRLPEWKME
jgi:hypothetical protein